MVGDTFPTGFDPTDGTSIKITGGKIVMGVPTRPVVTVSGLPACGAGTQGAMYLVTDALAPVALAIVGAGGAVKVGVICNGTNWIVQ